MKTNTPGKIIRQGNEIELISPQKVIEAET